MTEQNYVEMTDVVKKPFATPLEGMIRKLVGYLVP